MTETSAQHTPRDERLPLEVAVQFNGRHGPNQGRTINLSRGGMFVQTSHPGMVGERFFFQIQPEANTPIRFNVEGVVVWTRKRASRQSGVPKGMGIRFTVNPSQGQPTIEGIFSMLNQLHS